MPPLQSDLSRNRDSSTQQTRPRTGRATDTHGLFVATRVLRADANSHFDGERPSYLCHVRMQSELFPATGLPLLWTLFLSFWGPTRANTR
jgi:hypothetical protein